MHYRILGKYFCIFRNFSYDVISFFFLLLLWRDDVTLRLMVRNPSIGILLYVCIYFIDLSYQKQLLLPGSVFQSHSIFRCIIIQYRVLMYSWSIKELIPGIKTNAYSLYKNINSGYLLKFKFTLDEARWRQRWRSNTVIFYPFSSNANLNYPIYKFLLNIFKFFKIYFNI